MEYQRVRWACRRGMLELDQLLLPFFDNCYHLLPESIQQLFQTLLSLEDPLLYQWFIGSQVCDDKQLAALIVRIKDHAIATI